MAYTQAGELWRALEAARQHVTTMLSGAIDSEVIYCRNLVSWVLTNQGDPGNSQPSTEVRELIGEAINVGLMEAFGPGYRELIDDQSIFARCKSL